MRAFRPKWRRSQQSAQSRTAAGRPWWGTAARQLLALTHQPRTVLHWSIYLPAKLFPRCAARHLPPSSWSLHGAPLSEDAPHLMFSSALSIVVLNPRRASLPILGLWSRTRLPTSFLYCPRVHKHKRLHYNAEAACAFIARVTL